MLKKGDLKTFFEWWEATKVKIKSLSIKVSKRLNISEKVVKQCKWEVENIDKNEPDKNDKIVTYKNKIKEYYSNKYDAARRRYKVNWYGKGEKSTRKKKGKWTLWTKGRTGNRDYGKGVDAT